MTRALPPTSADRPILSKHVYALAYDLSSLAKSRLQKTLLRRRGVGAVVLQDVLVGGKQRLESLESSLAAFLACDRGLNHNVAALLSRSVSKTIEQIQDPIALSDFTEDLAKQTPLSSHASLDDLGELGRALDLLTDYLRNDELMSQWWSLGVTLANAEGPYLDSDATVVIAKGSQRLYSVTKFEWLKRLHGLSSLDPGSTVLAKVQEPYVDQEEAAIIRQKLDVFIREQLAKEKSFKVLMTIDEAGVTLFDMHIPQKKFQEARWSILLFLAKHANEEVTRSKLYRAYRGVDGNNNSAVAAHVSGLRKVLDYVFINSNKPEDLAVQSVDDLIVGIRLKNGGGPYKLALNPDQIEVNL